MSPVASARLPPMPVAPPLPHPLCSLHACLCLLRSLCTSPPGSHIFQTVVLHAPRAFPCGVLDCLVGCLHYPTLLAQSLDTSSRLCTPFHLKCELTRSYKSEGLRRPCHVQVLTQCRHHSGRHARACSLLAHELKQTIIPLLFVLVFVVCPALYLAACIGRLCSLKVMCMPCLASASERT